MASNIGLRVGMNLAQKTSHIASSVMKALKGKNDYGLK